MSGQNVQAEPLFVSESHQSVTGPSPGAGPASSKTLRLARSSSAGWHVEAVGADAGMDREADNHNDNGIAAQATATQLPSHDGATGETKAVDVENTPLPADVKDGNNRGSTDPTWSWPRQFCTAPLRRHRRLLRRLAHATVAAVLTAWWITGLILHRGDLGWVVPFLVWFAVCLRLLTLHVPVATTINDTLVRPTRQRTAPAMASVQTWLGRYQHVPLILFTVTVVLAGTFSSPAVAGNTQANRAVSLFGLLLFLGGFYATSRDPQHINTRAVVGGTLAQFLLGVFVLKTKVGYDIFNFVGDMAKQLLGYAGDGTAFLTDRSVLSAGWFLVSVVPAIIFFVAFVQLLSYWGWIQWLVGRCATVFAALLGISGAEAVVAAASPFLGQGESAVLVRAYMPYLTQAEIHQIMTSGFASIAGSVMSAYMQMGISPLALVSSCVMSIPASIALSKLRYPETEEPITRSRDTLYDAGDAARNLEEGQPLPLPLSQVQVQAQAQAQVVDTTEEEESRRPYNALHAVGKGSWLGLKIAGMVVASVLCIMGLLGLVNGLLGWWGSYIQVPQLSLELILGYLLYPVAFLLGVDFRHGDDLRKVAQLIGIKIVANEFVAYGDLTSDPQYGTLAPRSRLIAMYALCGFGNASAVGIQIGALSQLAPGRSGDVARLALSALITGIVATLTSASIAGMLMSNEVLLTIV
ncbi:Concentrative nucleoside transporter [Niveomyces insectorum RCEF 264]|uniref:Concentrative nucleoside transporter n=1 Tax=Niveomyces insectorum RCEF 264 TaxID=1081102 RepID=A0A167UWT4_9HYPO|nr:Concentrative nucleoside transporter [Niveomyces insectorum RCEF 264]